MTAAQDRVEIEGLLHEYAWRLDNGDLAGVGALFAHGRYGAVLDGELIQMDGADAVTRTLRSLVRLYDGRPRTRHVTTNVVIEVADDEAHARSYFTVLQQIRDAEIVVVMAGHYEDAFERADSGWRFTDRVIHAELSGDTSAHLLG